MNSNIAKSKQHKNRIKNLKINFKARKKRTANTHTHTNTHAHAQTASEIVNKNNIIVYTYICTYIYIYIYVCVVLKTLFAYFAYLVFYILEFVVIWHSISETISKPFLYAHICFSFICSANTQ